MTSLELYTDGTFNIVKGLRGVDLIIRGCRLRRWVDESEGEKREVESECSNS